jgi:hypothetical protein
VFNCPACDGNEIVRVGRCDEVAGEVGLEIGHSCGNDGMGEGGLAHDAVAPLVKGSAVAAHDRL